MQKIMLACLALVSLGGVLPFEVLQSSKKDNLQLNLGELKRVHFEASAALSEGGKSLGDTISPDLKQDFESAAHFTLLPSDTNTKSPTYRDLMARSEETLARYGLKVKVVVEAAPDNCQVTYEPIAIGGIKNFGLTRAENQVEPRTYRFVCECSEASKPSQVVDCTSDQQVRFKCQH